MAQQPHGPDTQAGGTPVRLQNAVSETALLTLKSRVLWSRRRHPVLDDPVGEALLRLLEQRLQHDHKRRRLVGGALSDTLRA